MPSREIQIRCKKSKSSVLPDFILDDAINRVSSVFKFGAPLRGLEEDEEKKLLPLITPLDPDSKTWRADANKFWAELVIKVASDGVELKIGLDKKGNPENVRDYIKYRFCMAHPLVARNEEDLKKKSTYRFYIYDPEEVIIRKHSSIELKASAYARFSQIKSGAESELVFGRILRLNGLNPDKMSVEALETSVANFLEATPQKFLTIAGNHDLADTALVEELVDQNVLRKLGTIYQFGDIRIGDTLDEAVAYIGSQRNSKHLVTMLARLEEKRKAVGKGVDDLKLRLGVDVPTKVVENKASGITVPVLEDKE